MIGTPGTPAQQFSMQHRNNLEKPTCADGHDGFIQIGSFGVLGKFGKHHQAFAYVGSHRYQ